MGANDTGALPEFSLIERLALRMRVAREDVALGIGDDAALIDFPVHKGMQLVSATDSLVEGTHFLDASPAASVGHRVLAANLSDLAAMGATPAWANLALTLPDITDWVDDFAEGFAALADQYDVALVGGDTVRGARSVTVTLQGMVPAGQVALRSGAQPGDLIFVSGMPGAAAAGRKGVADDLITSFLFPQPRVELGKAIAQFVNAMIDISDGLKPDLEHVLKQSGTGARVELDSLGLPDKLADICSSRDAVELALFGGEDFELLFTVPPERTAEVEAIAMDLECEIHALGEVTAADQVWLWQGEAIEIKNNGFRHF